MQAIIAKYGANPHFQVAAIGRIEPDQRALADELDRCDDHHLRTMLNWQPYVPRGKYVAARHFPALGVTIESLSATGIVLPHRDGVISSDELTFGEFVHNPDIAPDCYVTIDPRDTKCYSMHRCVGNTPDIGADEIIVKFIAFHGAKMYEHRYVFVADENLVYSLRSTYEDIHDGCIATKYAAGRARSCRIVTNMSREQTEIKKLWNATGELVVIYINDAVVFAKIGSVVHTVDGTSVTYHDAGTLRVNREYYRFDKPARIWRLTKSVTFV